VLVLDVESGDVKLCKGGSVSISYWDRFKIHSEPSQTEFKPKKGASHVYLERFFHALFFYILFSMVKNRRVTHRGERYNWNFIVCLVGPRTTPYSQGIFVVTSKSHQMVWTCTGQLLQQLSTATVLYGFCHRMSTNISTNTSILHQARQEFLSTISFLLSPVPFIL
jgi:hypothetical protein